MSEVPPVFRPLDDETYANNRDRRVKEPDMQAGRSYSFMSQLEMTLSGSTGEFQARLRQIIPLKMGQAALVVCLFEPASNDTLITFDARSDDGIILPTERHRIVHPYFNNLGVITEGYLLNNPDNPSITEDTTPRWLIEHTQRSDTLIDPLLTP